MTERAYSRALGAICAGLALLIAACWVGGALAATPGRFAGKFELVPLFDHGHRPVIKNGHQEYAERDTWTFTRPNGERVTVRAGRVTDLASIPALVWPILPPDGPYAQGAAGHDQCFKSRGFEPADRTRPEPYDHHGCDVLLDEMMVALRVEPWKRFVIFEAVELFGGAAWGS